MSKSTTPDASPKKPETEGEEPRDNGGKWFRRGKKRAKSTEQAGNMGHGAPPVLLGGTDGGKQYAKGKCVNGAALPRKPGSFNLSHPETGGTQGDIHPGAGNGRPLWVAGHSGEERGPPLWTLSRQKRIIQTRGARGYRYADRGENNLARSQANRHE